MKNLKRFLIIFIVNIIVFALFFFIADYFVYKEASINFRKAFPEDKRDLKYSYITEIPDYIKDINSYFNGKYIYSGRLPDGTEYSDNNAIVVFGCSYAMGEALNSDQTFTYKLSKQLKRPVYNRGGKGWSFQHMLYQTQPENIKKFLPKNTDTIVYIMILDHIRRCQLESFFVVDNRAYLHYSLKNGSFIQDNYNNPLSVFNRALYIRKTLNHIQSARYRSNKEKDINYVTHLSAKYIIESKKNIENYLGKKVNFIVFYYEPGNWIIPYKNRITKILENKDIKTISTIDLTEEDIFSEKYLMPQNWHPTEKAWDLLTPLFINKFGLE